jgi:putative DNA primase/helicase
MPTWLDSGRPNPSDVIAFQNGMVYANRLGNECEPIQMEPPSPAWFSETVLPCDFGHHFACPRWLKFLQSTLGQDRDGEELIGLLQEWFGYCLTGDTGQQKMLWLHGRSGAGKGTITKILQRTVGDRNCVSFSLWDLDRPFTLSSFLGKTLAISQDAHLEDSKDSARLLEQIKAITGEDDRFVDIKNRDPLAGVRLRTRFTISVNNFPPLRDVGDTLRRRLMIIPFEKSFAGKEDSGLLEKLTCEIPGIARWAIEGLRRLRQRGRFPETRKGLQMLDRFRRESNPFFEFIEDCCETPEPASWPKEKPEPVCAKESLYRAYKAWSKWSNDPRTKSRSWFHRDLRHSVPSICEHRPENDHSRRVRYYRWIRLNELGERFLHDMEISDTDEAEMFASNQA